MPAPETILLAAAIFAAALLYSSVGHGGASPRGGTIAEWPTGPPAG